MQIVADENIPYVSTLFAPLGEVRTVVGRDLKSTDLRDANILLVRSVTQVDKKLLAGSAVRFVGTATIGLDHIDLDYLQQQSIGFASAQGSNAISVAEYVISALLITAQRQGFQLNGKTVGIIGCGNVGSRVLHKLKALGVECVIYDPPLQEKNGPFNSNLLDKAVANVPPLGGVKAAKAAGIGPLGRVQETTATPVGVEPLGGVPAASGTEPLGGASPAFASTPVAEINYVNLDTALSADIITLHVPLAKNGRYPTYQLVNTDFLSKLRDDVILINTSRGAVVDETALLETLAHRPAMTVILDVWQNEPDINLSLLQRAALGTPHIAGYSLDGKARGTEMLYTAVCDYFQHTSIAQTDLPAPPVTRLSFSKNVDDNVAIHTAVMACYDVRRDDAALRCLKQATEPSTFFDELRKTYPVRREFSCVEIEVPPEKSALATQLRGLGFQVL